MKKPATSKKRKVKKGRRSVRIGTAPCSLIYVGEKKVDEVQAQIIRWSVDDFEENIKLSLQGPIDELILDSHYQWLNLHGLHDVEAITKIGNHFKIDKLILEDLLDTTQRPKVEEFANSLFFTLKSITDLEGIDFEMEQISFILTENSIISIQEKPADIFESIRERLRNKIGLVRMRGADYLLFLLLDALIDQYFVLLENVEAEIEDIQEEVVTNPREDLLIRTESLKRSLVILRKSVNPLKEAVNLLNRGDSKYLNPEYQKYYNDLKDSALEVIDSLDADRQMIESSENLYLSRLSQKNNDTMQVLTVIATIFIPLTFFAGVYGMNFEHMPELSWEYSYIVFWAFIVVVSAILIRYFRKKGWL